jgi:hypothetical protein
VSKGEVFVLLEGKRMGGRIVLCEICRNRVIFVKVLFMETGRSTDVGCRKTCRVV